MPNIAATNCQDSSKGFVTIADILQRSIHSFKAFSSHQWTLVPHNNSCVPKQSGSIRIFIEIAKVVIFYCEKNFESRVCSSSSCASYFSKDCFQQKSFSCASWRIYEYQSLSLCVVAICSPTWTKQSLRFSAHVWILTYHSIGFHYFSSSWSLESVGDPTNLHQVLRKFAGSRMRLVESKYFSVSFK